LTLRGFGLCENPARFSAAFCRFTAAANASRFLDTPAVLYADDPTRLNCSTPAWGLSFPDSAVTISLTLGSPGNASEVTARTDTSAPFAFACCIRLPLDVSATIPRAGRAKGGVASELLVRSWGLPFPYPFADGPTLSVAVVLPTNQTTAFVGATFAATGGMSTGVNASNATLGYGVNVSLPYGVNGTDLAFNARGGVVGFTSPPGGGRRLEVLVRHVGLPLLEFAAPGAYNFKPPDVTNVTNRSGSTIGGYNLVVDGSNFGGLDLGPAVILEDLDGRELSCNATTWRSDAQVVCEGVPAGTGANLKVFVSTGGQRGTSIGLFSYEVPFITKVCHADGSGCCAPDGSGCEGSFPTKGGVLLKIEGFNFGSNMLDIAVTVNGFTCSITTDEAVEKSDPINGVIYCEMQVGSGSSGLRVLVKGTSSDLFPVAYDKPTITKLTPSSNADVKGGQQLVVHGTNFGADSKDISVFLRGDGNFSRYCSDAIILVPHTIVLCKYPAYVCCNISKEVCTTSCSGTGQEIDVVIEVTDQTATAQGEFSYFDATGFFSIFVTTQMTARTSVRRALQWTSPDSKYWEQHSKKFKGQRYLVDQDYMRNLLSDEEQGRFTEAIMALATNNGITVYANGVLWFEMWGVEQPQGLFEHPDPQDPGFQASDAEVSITIRTVYTVDGETNAKRVKELFKYAIPGQVASPSKPRRLSDEVSVVENVTVSTIVTKGGDKSINGEVFCDKGKQPQSDGAKRQSCTYCPVDYFKPRIGRWYDPEVSQTAEGGCNGDDPLTCLDRLCLPCPLGGNCNTTGVVVPGRLDGYWRSPTAYDKEDYTRWSFYSCLALEACWGTRPFTVEGIDKDVEKAAEAGLITAKPHNEQCRFTDWWYREKERQVEYFAAADDEDKGHIVNEGFEDGSPLCSICLDGFFEYSFNCERCPKHSRVADSVAVVGAIGIFTFFFSVFYYLGWVDVRLPGFLARFARFFTALQQEQAAKDLARGGGESGLGSDQAAALGGGGHHGRAQQLIDGGKMKIALSFLQVSAVYNVVYDVTWPRSFVKMLKSFHVLAEFNLVSLPAIDLPGNLPALNLALECDYNVSFYDTFMFSELMPLAISLLFLVLGVAGWAFHKGKAGVRGRSIFSLARVTKADRARFSANAERHVTKCWELFFFMLLVIYPSVSRVTLQVLNCKAIDNGLFLAADYNLDCNAPRHRFYFLAGWVCVAVYVVGVPVGMLLCVRFGRKYKLWEQRVHILYASYTPRFWWFEVYDLMRKLFLTGLIIFIRPDTSTQIAVGCAVCMFSLAVHVGTYPFLTKTDNRLQTLSLACILWTMYIGLLLRIDIAADDEKFNLETLAYILIVSNSALIGILGPLAIPKFGRLLHSRIKAAWRRVRSWLRAAARLLSGREDFKLYVVPIGTLAAQLERPFYMVTVESRFVSVDELHLSINGLSGVDLALRAQALVFEELLLKDLSRPVTDYNVRAYRDQRLPRKIKPAKAAASKRQGGEEGGDNDEEEPEAHLAYYKGRIWGAEAVLWLRYTRMDDGRAEGVLEGEGFSRVAGDFKVRGTHYASQAERAAGSAGGSNLMFMFESESSKGGDAAKLSKNRYDLLFTLVNDHPPPDESTPERDWPTRDLSCELTFEAARVVEREGLIVFASFGKEQAKKKRKKAGKDGDDGDDANAPRADPVLVGSAEALDGGGRGAVGLEPLSRGTFLNYARRVRRRAATLLLASRDDLLDIELTRLRESQAVSDAAFESIVEAGDTAAAVRRAERETRLVSLRAEVSLHRLLATRNELDFERHGDKHAEEAAAAAASGPVIEHWLAAAPSKSGEPATGAPAASARKNGLAVAARSATDPHGAGWAVGGMRLNEVQLVVGSDEERHAVQVVLARMLDSAAEHAKRQQELRQAFEEELRDEAKFKQRFGKKKRRARGGGGVFAGSANDEGKSDKDSNVGGQAQSVDDAKPPPTLPPSALKGTSTPAKRSSVLGELFGSVAATGEGSALDGEEEGPDLYASMAGRESPDLGEDLSASPGLPGMAAKRNKNRSSVRSSFSLQSMLSRPSPSQSVRASVGGQSLERPSVGGSVSGVEMGERRRASSAFGANPMLAAKGGGAALGRTGALDAGRLRSSSASPSRNPTLNAAKRAADPKGKRRSSIIGSGKGQGATEVELSRFGSTGEKEDCDGHDDYGGGGRGDRGGRGGRGAGQNKAARVLNLFAGAPFDKTHGGALVDEGKRVWDLGRGLSLSVVVGDVLKPVDIFDGSDCCVVHVSRSRDNPALRWQDFAAGSSGGSGGGGEGDDPAGAAAAEERYVDMRVGQAKSVAAAVEACAADYPVEWRTPEERDPLTGRFSVGSGGGLRAGTDGRASSVGGEDSDAHGGGDHASRAAHAGLRGWAWGVATHCVNYVLGGWGAIDDEDRYTEHTHTHTRQSTLR